VHWDTVRSYLDRLDSPTTTYHVHVSNSNQLFDTYAGVDTCGDRLCRELDELVRSEEHADAECISFIGHSMGGLITRNAVAKAYDRKTKKLVLGGRPLEPTHFLSLATPHLGFADAERCPMESAWYIPFSRRLVPFVSSRVLGEAGRQFFHRDESKLILRMASHEQLEGLRAFKTRTAYGNVSGDHLVGWGNASLRDELEMDAVRAEIEALRDVKHRGVVREDAVDAAWRGCDDRWSHPRSSPGAAPESQAAARANISSLGWRRVDVSFRDARLSGLAHQHIMTQRKRLNAIGEQTARHVAQSFALYEGTSS
jgi:pimeloyl-ACP methyl ester carboxylesterase